MNYTPYVGKKEEQAYKNGTLYYTPQGRRVKIISITSNGLAQVTDKQGFSFHVQLGSLKRV